MIIKKSLAEESIKTKAQHIRDLTNYIVDPMGEKVLYMNSRGFLTDTFAAQQAEMIALAEEAVRSKNPVSHYIASWREGEQPTPDQIEELIDIFLDEMELKVHQLIYAVHRDTDNIHLHIAVNRVHPETLKVIKPNRGFDIEAIHRAIARIERAQGWAREKNGRYVTLDDGSPVKSGRKGKAAPGQRQRDMEHRTGEKSAERIAQENVPQIIRDVMSWQELHKQLAAIGMRYVQKGSGALIYVGETAIKASRADRAASMSALQKRFGEYEPAQDGLQIAKRPIEPMRNVAPGWNDFIEQRKTHYSGKTKDTIELRNKHGAERNQLLAQQKQRRTLELGGSWKGRGAAMNALRSIIAAQQAAEKAAMKERHALERRLLRETHGRFPDFEQWLVNQSSPEQAMAWRYRESQTGRICGHRYERPITRDIRAYTATIAGRGSVNYTGLDSRHVAFTDFGKNITVSDYTNSDSVLAALQLSAQKWGSFEVYGNDEYKALCVSLAAQHGFKISNPELQVSIEAARQSLRTHAQRNSDSSGTAADHDARHEALPERHIAMQTLGHPKAD